MQMNPKLRILKEEDHSALYHLILNNKNRLVSYFPNTVKENDSLENSRIFLKQCIERLLVKEQYLYGLFNEDHLIGYINVKNIDWKNQKCELSYFIDKSFEGKGLISHQVAVALNFCFVELKLVKVYLRIAKENIGSIRIAEKNGFEKEGVLRKEFRIETGELIDVLYYGKLNDQFSPDNKSHYNDEIK